MSNLAFQLDSITETHENLDFLSAISDAITYGVAPDLSDLFITEQYEYYDHDTNIRVEAIDLDGRFVTGVIQSWGVNPFDLYGEDDNEDFAYLLIDGDNEGSTYIHFDDILHVVESVIGYAPTSQSQPLSQLLPTLTSSEGSSEGTDAYQGLSSMPITARFPLAVFGIGA